MGGLIFVIALVSAGVALGAWALQRAAFDPSRSSSQWGAVIVDDAIRNEISTPIANATAATLNQPPDTIREQVDANLLVDDRNDPLPDHTAALLADAHARLLGRSDAPVRIDGEMMALAVRDERVGDLPGSTIDVPRVGALRVADAALDWVLPISAAVTALLLLLALAIHDERLALVRSACIGLAYLAAMLVVFGWLVPAYAVPLADDDPWADIPKLLAEHDRWWIVLAAVGLVAVAGAVLLAQAAAGRRRRWSTPINTARYSEQQRWS